VNKQKTDENDEYRFMSDTRILHGERNKLLLIRIKIIENCCILFFFVLRLLTWVSFIISVKLSCVFLVSMSFMNCA
jgi:hypothetical protein